jgi:serine/threonine-protein kinase
VTLLDFGIARSLTDVDDSTITRSGTVCGTVAYMAPEVACGEPAEPRSDLYSLGVMLYELLAGTRPFEHERADVVMRMHVTEDPPAIAHVPAVIESLVMRCLAKEPSGRFKDAVHLLAALDAALDAAPDGISGAPLTQDHAKVVPATATGERVLSISAPTADETTPQRPARRWWPWAAAALAIGVAIASWPRETPPAPVVTQPPAVAPAAPPPTVAPIVVARVPEAEARAETRSITAIYEAPPVPSADVRAPPKPATRPTKPRPERVAPEPAFIIPGG